MSIQRVKVVSSAEYTSTLMQEWGTAPLEELPTFDNTKLVAINTCPLWGLVRYTHHKTMNGTGRAMALEAGAAAHEVFAAHRLFNFREYGSTFYEYPTAVIEEAFSRFGNRIFGNTRFIEMCEAVSPDEDYRTQLQQFALTALYNCGFYDDPGDKRRTMTNIEEMCIAYMDRHDFSNRLPYWDGADFIGIEVPVDVVIKIDYHVRDPESLEAIELGYEDNILIRFIGKADGIHCTDKTKMELRIHENKTASRLGDAWEMSWETNHQPTGYMVALSALLQRPVMQAEMLGTCLPMPKSYAINGLARVVVKRHQWQIGEWFEWLLHTALLHEKHKNDPTNAPMYTHSCNRYFRPCSFIPLCATPPDERKLTFDEMTQEVWNPLHGATETSDE